MFCLKTQSCSYWTWTQCICKVCVHPNTPPNRNAEVPKYCIFEPLAITSTTRHTLTIMTPLLKVVGITHDYMVVYNIILKTFSVTFPLLWLVWLTWHTPPPWLRSIMGPVCVWNAPLMYHVLQNSGILTPRSLHPWMHSKQASWLRNILQVTSLFLYVNYVTGWMLSPLPKFVYTPYDMRSTCKLSKKRV